MKYLKSTQSKLRKEKRKKWAKDQMGQMQNNWQDYRLKHNNINNHIKCKWSAF